MSEENQQLLTFSENLILSNQPIELQYLVQLLEVGLVEEVVDIGLSIVLTLFPTDAFVRTMIGSNMVQMKLKMFSVRMI